MPGYNHFSNCGCGWCVHYRRRRSAVVFDGARANALVILRERQYKEGSYASCFVNPNATCPVCGVRVFFYANVYGSRVFFDELGGDWTKHPCTDLSRSGGGNQNYSPLARRARGEIDEIFGNLAVAAIDPMAQSRDKHGKDPENVYRVVAVSRRGFRNSLHSVELVGGEGDSAYFQFESATFEPADGDLFSFDGERLSFPAPGPERAKRFKGRPISVEDFDAAVRTVGAG